MNHKEQYLETFCKNYSIYPIIYEFETYMNRRGLSELRRK